MQVRCQRCGYMFTLGRAALTLALQEVERMQAKHYGVECPKCRRQIKIPVKEIARALPQSDSVDRQGDSR